MKRIEFFGPMGSGKSTLYSDLIKNKSLCGVVNAKQEVYDILLNHVKQSSKIKIFDFQTKKVLSHPFFPFLFC
jgi:Ni2+-binding GTPase involved in maturation of urease and hydrogenase